MRTNSVPATAPDTCGKVAVAPYVTSSTDTSNPAGAEAITSAVRPDAFTVTLVAVGASPYTVA